jgi:protein gp37
MQETKIIWTTTTWNPMTGCRKISPGCKFCYAETIAERTRGGKAFPVGFDPMIRPWKLNEPMKLKKPSMVFVNSMSDLFLSEIPDAYRHQVLEVIRSCSRHEFQVLTKRPENMLAYEQEHGPLPFNFWAGVSIESMAELHRADTLREVAAEIRFLSLEPLLGPLSPLDLEGIHWVIVGGESGNHLSKREWQEKRGLVEHRAGRLQPKPNAVDWVREIRDICLAAKVPFFFKQWGGLFPEHGGRVLDGVTWDQFPRYPEGMDSVNPHLDAKRKQTGLF